MVCSDNYLNVWPMQHEGIALLLHAFGINFATPYKFSSYYSYTTFGSPYIYRYS